MLIRAKGGCGTSSSSPRNAYHPIVIGVRRVQSLPDGLQDLIVGTALGPGHRPPRFWLFHDRITAPPPITSTVGCVRLKLSPTPTTRHSHLDLCPPVPRLTSSGTGARGLDAFAVFYSSEKCSMCLWVVTRCGN